MPLHGYISECEERQKIIVSKDKGEPRKHIANNINSNKVTHYKIDGVVITGNETKCDFLLINEDRGIVYLIELKGSTIERAIEQLKNTENLLRSQLSVYHKIMYRIVCSKARTHDINGTAFKKFKEKNYNSFKCKENTLEENI